MKTNSEAPQFLSSAPGGFRGDPQGWAPVAVRIQLPGDCELSPEGHSRSRGPRGGHLAHRPPHRGPRTSHPNAGEVVPPPLQRSSASVADWENRVVKILQR